MKTLISKKIRVYGVVQGVGFRPFVYRLANEHKLKGWVLNTSSSVEIEVEGEEESIKRFICDLQSKFPPIARIEKIEIEDSILNNYQDFFIRESKEDLGYQLISPDIAVCEDCLKELFNPKDRRYRYPFINCTNCGPRFTIIKDIPYDRKNTTMAKFKMCDACEREYNDPLDRRFHAQPNACPICGPKLWIEGVESEDPIRETIKLLKEGFIIAIKGLGGFHLTCDATNSKVVKLLRERKKRGYKPFAVMMKDLDTVKRYCYVSSEEEKLLKSPQSPIVLLRIKSLNDISKEVAPNNNYLGIMLPYTPLHHILLREIGLPLIMTSGNISEEPICQDNKEALDRLKGIADYFLLNNRDIYSRYDDSVVFVFENKLQMIRRARGYAPSPIKLPFKIRQTLACGGELKNTFCLTKDNYAFISQHIGDLENIETLEHFVNTIELYKRLFRVEPEVIACDMHPDYLSTRYALQFEETLPIVRVQHHHAHIVSCMADNSITEPVIGIAFDGSGYGIDGNIWGGEVFIADYDSFIRKAHLEYLPMPGGELAIRKPYRLAIGYLYSIFKKVPNLSFLDKVSDKEIKVIKEQIEKGINTPLTSSVGRLFDAISSILNICNEATYEGQPAIELEMAIENINSEEYYNYKIEKDNNTYIVKIKPLLEEVLDDIGRIPRSNISVKFHNTVARIIVDLSILIRDETKISRVALSGGCFQNRILLEKSVDLLKKEKFKVYIHSDIPCNDGGISLGQAIIGGRIGS
ncbi:MAG: carbamoyltransferase HypF [bacterium]|nr:carbamoyltransferase HypF [bacterium]